MVADRLVAVFPEWQARYERDKDQRMRMPDESQEDRVDRILAKLTQVRLHGLTCFGAETHKFCLNPKLDEFELSRFEKEHNINLPPDYRSFLKLAGNGGAGPYYGIYKLDRWKDFLDWTTDEIPNEVLSLPCPLYPELPRDQDWKSKISGVTPFQGMISIGSQECTYATGLIVSGPFVGRVVYLDVDGQAPFVVREPDFLSWYERWLDELLGGYDMSWFGFDVGGDEDQLFGLLSNLTSSAKDRIDALAAIRRLPRISAQSEEIVCDLLGNSVAGVRAAACAVVEKFKIAEGKRCLPDLLKDESPEVQLAAIGLSKAFADDGGVKSVYELLQSDDLDVARRAFFTLKEQDKISRDMLLGLVQRPPHKVLRYIYVHATDWRPEDEELLIRLLNDDDTQVRLFAVLGLRQNRLKSSLDGVIDLLDRETNGNLVDAILRMLGEVSGKRNADVLLAWAQKGDDFSRLAAIDSLCKLGDIRVESVARSLLKDTRSPVRADTNGLGTMSHHKSICEFVSDSLRSSPNQKLRSMVSKKVWPKFLKFWKSNE